ncbi:hypothetical protein PHYSODRAFT_492653 [Phytophthora sojae]|uniref:SWIM-type domain-containing protein n=1 Tax=Phytophthora sojae (strain P6497) TaxID=1094619 RepID=G4Z6X9_PHYSP|nr:hypothetical protein PHYSODRAFT_492653 [Phytophthora sojae]EGZ21033.1 hypothetical protein PHYSODRAFT_492653 [Phytophthora sojae]|eukprot:XP_009523750.1 hypothetical protein PHYSODRAFT_492653 [Phytophthora sojae]
MLKKLLDAEKKHIAKQNVLPAKEPLFYVFDAFDERNVCGNTIVAEVDMDKGTCTRCMVSEQLQVPCRHIQAVIFSRSKLKDSPLPMYDTCHYFHQAYLVPKLYNAFSAVNIRLPLYDTLSMTSAVKHSPLYLQAGRQIQRSTEVADVTRAAKRTKNRGEGPARSKKAALSLLQPCEVSDEDDAAQEISEFFDENVRSADAATRSEYTCTNCGNTSHNTRRCTTVTCEVEERGVGIVPGEYVVGESPFIACGIQGRYCMLIKNYR